MDQRPNKIDIKSKFKALTIGHIGIMLTIATCTWAALKQGGHYYVNVMLAIEKGVIDKDAIQKAQSAQKADFIEFKAEVNRKIESQDYKIYTFITQKR